MVNVEFTSAAREQALELPKTIRARIEKVVDRLKNWPAVSGAKPLRGELAGRYRVRMGDYRIQFFIEPAKRDKENKPVGNDNLVIEKVGHRDGFYDE